MTNNNHPITPPPELVEQWATANGTVYKDLSVFCQNIANEAARWGADQKLEACAAYLAGTPYPSWAIDLHFARRPKPPSLKEQALKQLSGIETCFRASYGGDLITDTIRRALESLPD